MKNIKKPWLNHYPDGVPEEINPDKFKNLIELFEDAFKRHRLLTAYKCMNKELSFQDWDIQSKKIAAYLQNIELTSSAKVAIMLPNLLQNPISIAAVIRAGFVVVNVNPLYTARELNYQLIDSEAEAIIILNNFSLVLEKAIVGTKIKHVFTTSVGDFLGLKGVFIDFVLRYVKKVVKINTLNDSSISIHQLKQIVIDDSKDYVFPKDIEPDFSACLQYTGGTTGVAKAAVLTHRNLVANCLQAEAWYRPALDDMNYDSTKETFNKNNQPVTVCALPLYHIFALTACLLLGLKSGVKNLLIPNPRDFKRFVRTLGDEPFHIFPGVNTLFNALMNQKKFDSLDFSNLRISIGGGMALTKSVAERWHKITGCPMIEGFGLSETSPVATVVSVNAKKYSGNVGLPVSSTEVRIVNEVGKAVQNDQVGEILVKGPQVMKGYWKKSEETKMVFTSDGFFKTGDLGTMDSKGFVKIVDRKKDMINISGFNVYPNEVEQVVSSHPKVIECAVVGALNNTSEEIVKLFVVMKDQSISKENLVEFCKKNLAAYKCPKEIVFKNELPKTNVGKISRKTLREA
jgi:long-chain acyl-CoA synthetase